MQSMRFTLRKVIAWDYRAPGLNLPRGNSKCEETSFGQGGENA